MPRFRSFETLLFWLVALGAGAALAPALILPPWLEYQALIERRKAADACVAALEYRLRATQKQTEHLRDDPAYLLRLAQEEFGHSLPGEGESVLVGPSPDGPQVPVPPPPEELAAPPPEDILPELSAFIEQALARYPYVGLFVHPATRPVLLVLGTVLLLTAIVLLGRAGVAHPPSPRPPGER